MIALRTIVTFNEKVFKEPYIPYYDVYFGHTFKVIARHEGDHYTVVCIDDPNVKVQGNVHEDELVIVTWKKKNIKIL